MAATASAPTTWTPLVEDAPEPAIQSELTTGPRGELGTWRIVQADGARLFSSDDPRMDLERAAAGQTRVTLELDLVARERTTLTWLVGASGTLNATLDGASLRTTTHGSCRHDDDVLSLRLLPGAHHVSLTFDRGEAEHWCAMVRVLDERFAPGFGAAVASLGAVPAAEFARARAEAASIVEELGVGPAGLVSTVRVAYPAGGVLGDVTLRAGATEQVVHVADARREPIALERIVTSDGAARATTTRFDALQLGERSVAFGPIDAAHVRSARAASALRERLAASSEPSRAPLTWRVEELERVLRERDPDRAWERLLTTDAEHLTAALARGQDPFASPRGYVRMALRSSLDDSIQPYELFVPTSYREGPRARSWPLVVTLHGFKGNAGDYFRNTFGLSRPSSLSLEAHGRIGTPPTSGPMFVVAPTGRGQTHYRYAGETDVLEVIADVRARFAIDPRRIYVTGGSMGGTGAAYLPFRHPDLFAASAALAGYHDQRVRGDTRHAELASWERFAEAERSDVDWAENALHLPMLLVRGTQDRPLEWTTRLAERLDALHYRFEHREPVSGHNVWTETYANGAIFQWFRRYARPDAPRHVIVRSARERHSRAYWLSLDRRARPDAFGEIDARVERRGIVVATSGTAAFTIDMPEALTPTLPFDVVVDGARWSIDARRAHFERDAAGRWQRVTAITPVRKRPGVSGPIRDVYGEPLVFVVGTRDPRFTLMNRIVAEDLAHPEGWDVRYPIIDDVDATDALARDHALVLIGSVSSNALLARYAPQLPIGVTRSHIRVGETGVTGAALGASFIAPNPDHPDRALWVVTAVAPLGIHTALSLPDLLPDYVVYTEELAPARGRFAAGGTGARWVSAGYFDSNFSLLPDVSGPPR